MTRGSRSSISPRSRRTRLALGILAIANNADDVATTILRARRHGLTPIVALAGPSNSESARFANQLDVTMIKIATDNWSVDEQQQTLTEAARERGFDGLLFAADAKKQIDFDESLAAFVETNAFTIPTVEKRSISSGDTVVGIPAYNEAENIEAVVSSALMVADSVIIVNDGSTDDTAELAADAGADVISHSLNRGYGAALKTLFSVADDCGVSELVVIDADGQHDPDDIPALLDHRARQETDIVIGTRLAEDNSNDIPLLRQLGIRVINGITNLLLYLTPVKMSVTDSQSGFRVYGRAAIETLAASDRIGDGMASSTDILFVAAKSGLSVSEMSVSVDYNVSEPNTHHPLAHGLALVRNIIRIIETEYPITLLGLPGLFILTVGLGFGYWTTANYISSRTFPIGLAITATLFTILGIFTIFTAIILHSLRDHYRSIGHEVGRR